MGGTGVCKAGLVEENQSFREGEALPSRSPFVIPGSAGASPSRYLFASVETGIEEWDFLLFAAGVK